MGEARKQSFEILNGESFVVRTAAPDDAAKVRALMKMIMEEAPYLVTTEAEFTITVDQEKQFLEQMNGDYGKLAIVAERENEIIGFLDFHNGNRHRTAHQGSFGMTVKKEYRQLGVGTALLKTLLQWAEDHPLIEKVCLEVFAENEAAISLYKRFGFREEGVKRKAVKTSAGTYHDLLLMARFIG
ncbi:MAG: GNAT family N-acetyltransferase [Bacillus sp. (in: firmicutes)]